jgi:hypothetical protein
LGIKKDLMHAKEILKDDKVNYLIVDSLGDRQIVSRGNINELLRQYNVADEETLADYAALDVAFTNAMYTEGNGMEILDESFYRRQADELLRRADAVSGIPDSDVFTDGQVLTFSKRFPGTAVDYQYAAIKVEDQWYITGQNNAGRAFNWSALIAFVGIEALKTIKVLVMESIPLKEYARELTKALEVEAISKDLDKGNEA